MTDIPDWTIGAQLIAPGDLGELSVAHGQVSVIGSYTLSPYATGILVVPFAVVPLIQVITIQGSASGHNYVDLINPVGQLWPVVWEAIAGQSDNPVQVNIALVSVNNGGALPVCHVYELFGAGVQVVRNNPMEPLYVAQVPDVINGAALNNLQVAHLQNAIAASGSLTVIAASGVLAIKVYGYDLAIRANVSATVGIYEAVMEDSTAAITVAQFDLNWATAVGQGNQKNQLYIPPGILLPGAAGLKIVAAAGNPGALAVFGTVLYTLIPVS